MEIVLTVVTDKNPESIPDLLQQLGTEAISGGRAYLAGEVVGPRGMLFKLGHTAALVFLPPAFWDDKFASTKLPDGSTCVFALAVPIMAPEADFIRAAGRDAFEDRVIDAGVDLADPLGPSVV